MVAELTRCIRTDLDCAEVCACHWAVAVPAHRQHQRRHPRPGGLRGRHGGHRRPASRTPGGTTTAGLRGHLPVLQSMPASSAGL